MKLIQVTILMCFISTVFAETPVFHCVGTEPFWNMNVSEGKRLMRFSTPEGRIALRILRKRIASGSADQGAFILESKYTSLIVAPAECNDGMSDNAYTHAAVFDMGGRNIYYGCCDIDSTLLE